MAKHTIVLIPGVPLIPILYLTQALDAESATLGRRAPARALASGRLESHGSTNAKPKSVLCFGSTLLQRP